MRDLDTRIGGLSKSSGDKDGRPAEAAGRAGRSGDAGEYACGVSQYKDGDFAAARKPMEQFVADDKNDGNTARAMKVAIAAEVAQTLPDAGKKLPTTASGGSISVTVKNDSPHVITVLYVGPVTGSFTLKACGSCTSYTLADTLLSGFKPCNDSGKDEPGLGHRRASVRLHLHGVRLHHADTGVELLTRPPFRPFVLGVERADGLDDQLRRGPGGQGLVPAALVVRHDKRYPLFRAKDGVVDTTKGMGYAMVPFGIGIDYRTVFSRVGHRTSHKPMVEQDNAPTPADPGQCLRHAAIGYRDLAALRR
ncbi:hypothetical protein [Streptomyces camelliae]|uniref:Uncharacterized protein n=1 Tax=Streptomyces camelliae TaxID=3004093 RepID=A0ABY7PCM3_9ACTN|nr:hypothetical protein [Streptomyces sp. HUAS 2-6]WBO68349.1 hypothetical protein O1G22_38805 [Streptomyces sp. HUAS 2-6]